MEVRLHGRGGQGAVTGAKVLASIYTHLGKSVQAFGDYAGERSGAPVRAYLRVADAPIENRNKVYAPDHLLVFDPSLLGDAALEGLAPGGSLLVNTPTSAAELAARCPAFRPATVDATAIARRHRIGTRSVVIVNTTLAGAFARVHDLPFDALQRAFEALGLLSNLDAAREAFEAVWMGDRPRRIAVSHAASSPAPRKTVLPLTEHVVGPPTGLRTGLWRSQTPRYRSPAAPCTGACPAGNDVIGFVRALATEGEAAAAEILARTTALPAVCGRVCPAPCATACNRIHHDGAVQIRALERWIADHTPAAPEAIEPAPDPRRIAIVGGGPAGLAAAHALARAGHRAIIFELEPGLGGVLRTGIPEYRLPRAVLEREIETLLGLGVEARCGEAVDAVRLAELAGEHDALILATGLQRLRGLDCPGSDLEGVEQGIRFLHRQNRGAGAALEGHVVVLGGGNTAFDCARSALRAGAERVTIAYRRTRAEMPAIAAEIDEAVEEGVVLLFQRQPLAFRGRERVAAIELAEVEMGEPDESGRRRPVVTERSEELACDTVLLALGQSADLVLLPEGWTPVEGRVVVQGEPGSVFLAGDLATYEGTVTHAIGDGRRAAARALAAIGVPDALSIPLPDAPTVPPETLRFDHFPPAAPAAEQHLDPRARIRHLDEVNAGLEGPDEAQRCLSCGRCTLCDTCLVFCPDGVIQRNETGYTIDGDYCKGCGICVVECPRGCMEMTLQ